VTPSLARPPQAFMVGGYARYDNLEHAVFEDSPLVCPLMDIRDYFILAVVFGWSPAPRISRGSAIDSLMQVSGFMVIWIAPPIALPGISRFVLTSKPPDPSRRHYRRLLRRTRYRRPGCR
jgi:hypothetical protein